MNENQAGKKNDTGKNRLDLLPPGAIWAMGEVLTDGAAQYGENNWRLVLGWRERYLAAGLRHVFDYMMGKKYDKTSGRHNLAHALCCFSFILDLELTASYSANERSLYEGRRGSEYDPAPTPEEVRAFGQQQRYESELQRRSRAEKGGPHLDGPPVNRPPHG